MGLTVSVGKDNDELVDNLVSHDSVNTGTIEKIMRLVDRGRFLPESERESAYKDSAWKADTGDPGPLHLSAPCIYASVLENLDLQSGMSFLNVGSGSGYLSTMIGFILGGEGVSHGVELYDNVVTFATDRINEIQQSDEACAFDWCHPYYMVGNAFQIKTQVRYDRIYCGALVPESQRPYFCSFLKIGGILIMPYGHALQKIVRKSEREFMTRDISAVTFSHLIPINPDNPITNHPVKIPQIAPLSLRYICRNRIRSIVREKVLKTHKIEMRVMSIGKSGNWRSTRRPRDDDDSSQENEGAFRFRRRRFQFPVVLFERDGEEHDEDNPNQNEAPNLNRRHPMRHLFALVARERLNRHHAARARQAAGLAVEAGFGHDFDSDEEPGEQQPQVRRFPFRSEEAAPNSEAEQNMNGQENGVFDFEFVRENPTDDEDHDHQAHFHPIINVRPHAELREDGELVEAGRETETEDHFDRFSTEESEESDEENNESGDGGPDTRMQDETDHPEQTEFVESEESREMSGQLAKEIDDVLHSNDIEVGSSSGAKVAEKLKTEKVSLAPKELFKLGNGKRQRTVTSLSTELASKIKRTSPKNELEDLCADTTSSSVASSTRQTGNPASANEPSVDLEKGEAIAEDGYRVDEDDQNQTDDSARATDESTTAEGRLSPGSSSMLSDAPPPATSTPKEEENEKAHASISAEQQAANLKAFCREFTHYLEELPLNPQMLRFLKYQLN